jgi:hypothetical protein
VLRSAESSAGDGLGALESLAISLREVAFLSLQIESGRAPIVAVRPQRCHFGVRRHERRTLSTGIADRDAGGRLQTGPE